MITQVKQTGLYSKYKNRPKKSNPGFGLGFFSPRRVIFPPRHRLFAWLPGAFVLKVKPQSSTQQNQTRELSKIPTVDIDGVILLNLHRCD